MAHSIRDFDTDGIVTTDFNSDRDEAFGIVIDSSDKIVVAGFADNGSNNDFAIARYNTNGSLDTTFDSDGKVTTDFDSNNEVGAGVTIDSSGRIIVAGAIFNGSNEDFAVARYNTNGSLDTNFDTDGKTITDFNGNNDGGSDITLDSNGNIIVIGGSNNDFAVAKYNTDGSLDTSFSTDGKVTADFGSSGESGNAVVVDSFDRIVVAGRSDAVGGTTLKSNLKSNLGINPTNVAVARFTNTNLVVNKTADTNDGSCDAVDCSLREAVAAANSAATNDTITFDSSLAGQTITLTLGSQLSTSNNGSLNIVGLGANQLTVSGNNSVRVFTINGKTTISGLTITGGNADFGGGIRVRGVNGNLTLTDSTVSGNSATSVGGGILSTDSLLIKNSTVSGNSAPDGGGVYVGSSTSTIIKLNN